MIYPTSYTSYTFQPFGKVCPILRSEHPQILQACGFVLFLEIFFANQNQRIADLVVTYPAKLTSGTKFHIELHIQLAILNVPQNGFLIHVFISTRFAAVHRRHVAHRLPCGTDFAEVCFIVVVTSTCRASPILKHLAAFFANKHISFPFFCVTRKCPLNAL